MGFKYIECSAHLAVYNRTDKYFELELDPLVILYSNDEDFKDQPYFWPWQKDHKKFYIDLL